MRHLRQGDLFARLGGDEFSLLLSRAGANDAEAAAKRIVGAVKGTPLRWGAIQLSVSVSIGILSAGQPGVSPEILLDSADRVLYETKRCGRNGYTVFRAADTVSNIIHLTDFPLSGTAVGS